MPSRPRPRRVTTGACARRGRPFTLALRIAPIAVAALSLPPAAQAGSTAPAPAAAVEFAAGPLAPPDAASTQPLDLAVEAGLRWLAPLEDDLDAVYGGIPVAEARVGLRLRGREYVYFGAGYGRASGDGWAGDPTFTGVHDATLVVLPLELGIRWDLSPRPDFRVNLGWRAELAWVRETTPGGGGLDGDGRREEGWLRGLGFGVGPEWLSRDGRRAVGFEAGLQGSGGRVGGRYGRDSNLSGAWIRAYVTTGI